MDKLKVFRFTLLEDAHRIIGYNEVFVYAKDYNHATDLLEYQFPFVINEYNIDWETGREQYSCTRLKKIYPQMYAKPNYLIINNPHQTRKKQQ